ncbi:hypothetical protein [Pandoraea oxalativorans]|uniref:Uncharacterized protein n=1 Tax=Pandoraea oxalativorans TaxID=573737 RepID=A0A0G3IE43_9BURK|nr:hypothetical protein [Pandoraea oxalativorans]AKK24823.1 hypothetical protein MB84_29010 [Pandoraea oxalativorans]
MTFIRAGANQFPVFHTILNASVTPKANKDWPESVYTRLAERFLGGAGRPAEPLSISISGEDKHAFIEFTDIPDGDPAARGAVVLDRIANRLEGTLMGNGADNDAARAAARNIAAQLGDEEFETLEQTAVQKALGDRMNGVPVSRTHIALGHHGEVMVHKTTQWASYENDNRQTIRSAQAETPILEARVVIALRLVRGDTKTFALLGKVERFLLETPAADLKARLMQGTESFIDTILNAIARIFRRAGILIEPPSDADNKIWDSTPRGLDDLPAYAPDAVPLPPQNILSLDLRRVQASHSGVKERNAALAFGHHCMAVISAWLPNSGSRKAVEAAAADDEEKKAKLRQESETYAKIINEYRREFAPEIELPMTNVPRFKPMTAKKLLGKMQASLETSTGNCFEMTLAAAAFARSRALVFFSEQGLTDVSIETEMFHALSNNKTNEDRYEKRDGEDHAFCVVKVRVNGHSLKMAIDPWMNVCLPYNDYLDYASAHTAPPYTTHDTKFGINQEYTNLIKTPEFIETARDVVSKKLSAPPPGEIIGKFSK